VSYLWQAQLVDDVKEELEEEEAEGKSWGKGERQGPFRSHQEITRVILCRLF